MATKEHEDTLLDYEEEEEDIQDKATGGAGGDAEAKKTHQLGVHSSSFKDFFLKPELVRAIADCAFESPSEVQHHAIPQALLGNDLLCQARSGMGKTAVFVLTTLNQLRPKEGEVSVLVLCHTRELADQIAKEYSRFSKYLPGVKAAVIIGGVPVTQQVKKLEEEKPQIIIGTPGRVMDLIERGSLVVDKIKHFVMDECDKMLEELDMRRKVQQIFLKTPKDKQVMMFSATMAKDVKAVCVKFMREGFEEITVQQDSKLTLHGLLQYYAKLEPKDKNRKLAQLLDDLEFNQAVIFVSERQRATALDRLLREHSFPSMHIHGGMPQEERLAKYNAFRNFEARILVTTNLMGRGIDIQRVNVVINYDFPNAETESKDKEPPADQYLHRVGRAGRFNTPGLAISFISSEADEAALKEVQARFEVEIPTLPDHIDPAKYSNKL